jgi:hypothetical protein
MTLDPETKDFLLHLHDKLWENMAAKEGRLWNYLSVYGAAVALALGAGGFGGVELQAAVLVLALTVWAVLIVINANWWYQRNRLMVTQIEKRFAEGGGLDGVIPKAYRDAVFQMDRLYRGSVLILSTLALLLYLRSMWLHQSAARCGDQVTIYSLAGLYVLSILSIMYCTSQHESYITAFYMTKRTLLLERDPKADVHPLPQEEKTARSFYGWKVYCGFALVYAMVVFDMMPACAAGWSASRAVGGILLQVASIVFFYVVLRLPGDLKRWKSWLARVFVLFLIIGSAAILLH